MKTNQQDLFDELVAQNPFCIDVELRQQMFLAAVNDSCDSIAIFATPREHSRFIIASDPLRPISPIRTGTLKYPETRPVLNSHFESSVLNCAIALEAIEVRTRTDAILIKMFSIIR